MTLKHNLLAGVAMTAAERSQGRYMRAPDGHGDPAPSPAPAPEPTPAPAASEGEASTEDSFGMEEDFSDFESKARGDEPKVEEEEGDDSGDEEADTGDDGDSGDGSDADGDGDGDEPELTDEQKRIKELEEQVAREKESRERDRDERLRKLEEENERLRNPDKKGEEQSAADAPPNPDDYEYGDADSAYIADKARYDTLQEIDRREGRRQMEEGFREMETNWNTQIASEEVKEKYPDFQEKVLEPANRGDWKLSFEGSLLVRSSPVGADVAYHLASDPTESRRIAGLSVVEQAQEIGRIEGRYLASKGTAQSEPARETPKAKPSKAPPPPKKTVRGAGGRFDIDPATDDFSAFEAKSRKVLESQQ